MDQPSLAWTLSAIWIAYLLLLGGWIVLQKRSPVATLGWLLALGALPYIGFFIYYLFGPCLLYTSPSPRDS